MTETLTDRAAALDAIYDDLPALDCKRLCQDSCGPFPPEIAERERLLFVYGTTPDVNRWTCPLLVRGQCRGHAIRPILCRLWGSVETMRCPHGCEPEWWLTVAQGYEFVQRVRKIVGAPPL